MRHLVPELRETKQEPHALPTPRWARPPVPGRQGRQPEEAQTRAGRGVPFWAPWCQHISGLAAFWGALAPSRGSHAGHKALTRPEAQLLKAGAGTQGHTQTQQRPFLPVAGLAEPGGAWESWLQTLPPRTRCQDSRPASVSEPRFPRSQSQVQTELAPCGATRFGSVPVSLHSRPRLGRRGPRATLPPEVQGGGGKAGQAGGRQERPTPLSPGAQVWAPDQLLLGGAASQRGARQLH